MPDEKTLKDYGDELLREMGSDIELEAVEDDAGFTDRYCFHFKKGREDYVKRILFHGSETPNSIKDKIKQAIKEIDPSLD